MKCQKKIIKKKSKLRRKPRKNPDWRQMDWPQRTRSFKKDIVAYFTEWEPIWRSDNWEFADRIGKFKNRAKNIEFMDEVYPIYEQMLEEIKFWERLAKDYKKIGKDNGFNDLDRD